MVLVLGIRLVMEVSLSGRRIRGNWRRSLMEYLTVNKIIEIHNEIIKEYGGTRGLRDEGTLELLVYKANRENTAFRRPALILYTIAAQHPFFDGNKRTALVTAEKFLMMRDII
jgi:death-on-curing protein